MADSTPRSLTYLPDAAVPFEPIVPQVSSVSYMSFVPLFDGTVGVTWAEIGGVPAARTGFVYWGGSPDPTTLSTVAGSVVSGTLLISQTAQMHAGFRSTVQRGPDGDLYLMLWLLRSTTLVAGLLPLPPGPGTYVYRSADEGVSWVLHGTVQLYAGGVSGSFGGYGSLGEIYFSDSGRWILPYGRIGSFGGGTRGSAAIAYSDDLGVTWTTVANHGAGDVVASTRQIVYNTVDGLLYYCSNRGLNNPDFQWRVSADDGVTWTVFESAPPLSGDPFENQNFTGVTTATGMQWFTGMATRARVYNVDTALSVSASPQTDPVMIRNWEAFDADLNVTIEPVGGGIWVVADSDELLQVMEESDGECSAFVTVTCCEDLL